MKDIIVVGGGTAGLIASLVFKSSFPYYNIKVIKSSDIGIVGVGEGSTEHWDFFQGKVGIDHVNLIKETDATIKYGILFKDWKEKNTSYAHSLILEEPKLENNGDIILFNQLIFQDKNNPYILSGNFKKWVETNSVGYSQNNLNFQVSNQYHFDTHKLNDFLQKECKKIGIKIEDHYIKNINLDDKGNISSLINDKKEIIKGDFFIDSTGFKRLLSSKLNSKFISYQKYLPMNQAITLSTDLNLDKGIEPYTKATALSSGWAWKIPTQTRYGNGYVFCNNYISSDEALNEFNKHLKTNIEKVAKDIKFEAGRLDKFWNKNCVSIGLSSGFIEPLEAQSIGFSIIQSFSLVDYFKAWLINPLASEKYNEEMIGSFNNTVDYIQLHYFSKRKDSKFWKDKPYEITPFNKETFKHFSKGNFSRIFFSKDYFMFRAQNFYQVYYGLDLLDKKSIKQSLDNTPIEKLDHFENIYKNTMKHNSKIIKHLDYLNLLKLN